MGSIDTNDRLDKIEKEITVACGLIHDAAKVVTAKPQAAKTIISKVADSLEKIDLYMKDLFELETEKQKERLIKGSRRIFKAAKGLYEKAGIGKVKDSDDILEDNPNINDAVKLCIDQLEVVGDWLTDIEKNLHAGSTVLEAVKEDDPFGSIFTEDFVGMLPTPVQPKYFEEDASKRKEKKADKKELSGDNALSFRLQRFDSLISQLTQDYDQIKSSSNEKSRGVRNRVISDALGTISKIYTQIRNVDFETEENKNKIASSIKKVNTKAQMLYTVYSPTVSKIYMTHAIDRESTPATVYVAAITDLKSSEKLLRAIMKLPTIVEESGSDIFTEPTPGYLMFLEDVMDVDLQIRENKLAINDLILKTYYPETFEEDGGDRTGLFNKIADGIMALVHKVSQMLDRMMDAIKGIGKEKMTSADYMKSDTGKGKLSSDKFRIEQELKACARQQRKVIMMISDVTKMNPALVELAADTINKQVAKMNWTDLTITGVRKAAAIKSYKEQLPVIRKLNAQIAKKTKELKERSKEIKDVDERLKALEKLAEENAALSKKMSAAILNGEDIDEPKKKPRMGIKETARLLYRA